MGIGLGGFGDRRLEKGGSYLLGRLMEHGGRGLCVRRLGGNRAGEIRITRFLRNCAVSVGEMVMEAASRTSRRCVGRDVLVIQDTTVVRSSGGGGDYLHAAIALDEADGAILGLVDGGFLRRSSGKRLNDGHFRLKRRSLTGG